MLTNNYRIFIHYLLSECQNFEVVVQIDHFDVVWKGCMQLKSKLNFGSELNELVYDLQTINFLVTPKSKMKCYGDKSFSVAAPKSWNSLPKGIRSLDSLAHSKSAIKTYLFNIYY